jgi:hypothetical protein
MSDPVTAYGWTAVPRDVEKFLSIQGQKAKEPTPISVKEIALPDTELANKVHEYAKRELAVETYNHSLRVFYYGELLFLPNRGIGRRRRAGERETIELRRRRGRRKKKVRRK